MRPMRCDIVGLNCWSHIFLAIWIVGSLAAATSFSFSNCCPPLAPRDSRRRAPLPALPAPPTFASRLLVSLGRLGPFHAKGVTEYACSLAGKRALQSVAESCIYLLLQNPSRAPHTLSPSSPSPSPQPGPSQARRHGDDVCCAGGDSARARRRRCLDKRQRRSWVSPASGDSTLRHVTLLLLSLSLVNPRLHNGFLHAAAT